MVFFPVDNYIHQITPKWQRWPDVAFIDRSYWYHSNCSLGAVSHLFYGMSYAHYWRSERDCNLLTTLEGLFSYFTLFVPFLLTIVMFVHRLTTDYSFGVFRPFLICVYVLCWMVFHVYFYPYPHLLIRNIPYQWG